MSEATHLLDTHAWVWFVGGDPRAKPCATLPTNTTFAVSAISIWEVGMLDARHRLKLHPDPLKWTTRALENLVLWPLSPEVALLSSSLPGTLHGDPADRIIIATAMISKSTLITADHEIIRYARAHKLRVLAL